MEEKVENDYFTVLNNKNIGENIAWYRKLRKIDVSTISRQLGISEDDYRKYEDGTFDLTIGFVQKAGEMLKVDPMLLLSSRSGQFIGGIHNSPFGGIGNYVGGDFQMQDEKQNQMMLKLMENMLTLSDRVIEKIGKLCPKA